MIPGDFQEALLAYRQALNHFHAEATRRRIDGDYKKAGRRALRALKRVREIAARHKILWDCGHAWTFY